MFPEMFPSFSFPLGEAEDIRLDRRQENAPQLCERSPIWDVHHPREQLDEVCPWNCGFRQAANERVDSLKGLVMFVLKRGVVI